MEEASQAIDQMDVDTQVLAESSRSGGRCCSKCGQHGHNAKTCQVVINRFLFIKKNLGLRCKG
jgi:hypothetical protein